jgi:hypothetical protein
MSCSRAAFVVVALHVVVAAPVLAQQLTKDSQQFPVVLGVGFKEGRACEEWLSCCGNARWLDGLRQKRLAKYEPLAQDRLAVVRETWELLCATASDDAEAKALLDKFAERLGVLTLAADALVRDCNVFGECPDSTHVGKARIYAQINTGLEEFLAAAMLFFANRKEVRHETIGTVVSDGADGDFIRCVILPDGEAKELVLAGRCGAAVGTRVRAKYVIRRIAVPDKTGLVDDFSVPTLGEVTPLKGPVKSPAVRPRGGAR